jgi:hypothetical protein
MQPHAHAVLRLATGGVFGAHRVCGLTIQSGDAPVPFGGTRKAAWRAHATCVAADALLRPRARNA